MNDLNSKSLKNICKLPFISVFMLIFISCRHFPIRETTISLDAHEEYKTNLLQWNSMASCNKKLNPVSPLPLGHYELPVEELNMLNALFLIGFSVVSDANAAEPGFEADHNQNNVPFDVSGNRDVLIMFDVPETADQEDPKIAGVLLDGTGWVLTVAHPFSNPSLANVPLYARMGEDSSWYSADERMIARSSNIALMHFTMPQKKLLPPGFARAEQGNTAAIDFNGTRREIRIEETEERLQLGDSLVFSANLLSMSIKQRDGLVSGIPLVNGKGEILGLYYYQSLDGTFSGYAGWKELPDLIDSMIHLLHRELLSDLRRKNS